MKNKVLKLKIILLLNSYSFVGNKDIQALDNIYTIKNILNSYDDKIFNIAYSMKLEALKGVNINQITSILREIFPLEIEKWTLWKVAHNKRLDYKEFVDTFVIAKENNKHTHYFGNLKDYTIKPRIKSFFDFMEANYSNSNEANTRIVKLYEDLGKNEVSYLDVDKIKKHVEKITRKAENEYKR